MRTVLYSTPECMVCGKGSAMTLDAKAFDAWRAGTLVQVAFPRLTADERELMISGTHGPCWEKMFA